MPTTTVTTIAATRRWSADNRVSSSPIVPADNDMKRVNVQVPDEIHTRAKVIAVLRDTTLSEYLERAIRDAVERDKAILERLPR